MQLIKYELSIQSRYHKFLEVAGPLVRWYAIRGRWWDTGNCPVGKRRHVELQRLDDRDTQWGGMRSADHPLAALSDSGIWDVEEL